MPNASGKALTALSSWMCLAAIVVSAIGCASIHQAVEPKTPTTRTSPHPQSTRTTIPKQPAAKTASRHEEEPQIPVIALSKTPPAVRLAIVTEAHGRSIEKINRMRELAGPVYRAYIHSDPGTQLLTLNEQGEEIDNAVPVRFEDMPQAVQDVSKTAVIGKLQACRKSTHRQPLTYVLDYLLGDEEFTFALIEANGFMRGLYGYAESDPD